MLTEETQAVLITLERWERDADSAVYKDPEFVTLWRSRARKLAAALREGLAVLGELQFERAQMLQTLGDVADHLDDLRATDDRICDNTRDWLGDLERDSTWDNVRSLAGRTKEGEAR